MNCFNVVSTVRGFTHRTFWQHCTLLLIASAAWSTSVTSYAEVAPCDAKWMHDGGGVTQVTSNGLVTMQISARDFNKANGENCSATLMTTVVSKIAGRTARTDSRGVLRIVDGRARLESALQSAGFNGETAVGSLSTHQSGLFSYVGKFVSQDASLPGERFEASLAESMPAMPGGQFKIPKSVVTTTAKHVGKQEQLDTVVGRLNCWPISYDRMQQATSMMVLGRTLTVGAVTTHVVDHFCPDVGLVMRSDVVTYGQPGAVTVTEIR